YQEMPRPADSADFGSFYPRKQIRGLFPSGRVTCPSKRLKWFGLTALIRECTRSRFPVGDSLDMANNSETVDIERAKKAAEHVLNLLGGAVVSGMIYLGDRMGLYQAFN